jgi:hypothetical protein
MAVLLIVVLLIAPGCLINCSNKSMPLFGSLNMRYSTSIVCFVVLAVLPNVAWASDPSGLATAMYIAFVMAPWGLFNSIALAYYFSKHRYTEKYFAKKHCVIASVIPALGFLLSLLDFSDSHYRTDQYIFYAIILGGLLLAGLPMAAYRLQRHT